ncbi:kinase-like domain-containing protein [Mycena polygramma]|nr:kinase-like domain-containing protein [Mycena polygramma]
MKGTYRPRDIYWRDMQPWLEEHGYMLRARYRPGWVPSWHKNPKSYPPDYEDFWAADRFQIMDATRISDGSQVLLKKIETEVHPHEVDICNFLSSEPLGSDPKNHCLPLLQVLETPVSGTLIIVMKILRNYGDPHFDTVGEAIDFLQQIFEGVQFMHKHHVAHRDCCSTNIMMDASQGLYPHGFHPHLQDRHPDGRRNVKHRQRTQAPPKYYLIDFGISVRFDPDVLPHKAYAIEGGDKSPPEFMDGQAADFVPVDPFPTDVYYLGNLIRTEFLDGQLRPDYPYHTGRTGFEFLRPLANDMINPKPEERPTMDEVVARFDTLVSGLSTWKLRSAVLGRDEWAILVLPHLAHDWYRRIGYMLRGVPPIPNYRTL